MLYQNLGSVLSIQFMAIFLAFQWLRQEDHMFQVILGYRTRPCLKQTTQNNKNKKNLQLIYLLECL